MNKNDMIMLNDFVNSRNLTKRTKYGYEDALKKYTNFHNESFINLLKEADFEEEKRIRWKNRKLKKRLLSFRSFLNENYMDTTAKVHFQRILTLYTHYEIEIYKLPSLSNKSLNSSVPINFEDLPTKEIIKEALNISSPVMKSIILFMCSSGCARKETLNLTIQDFINATGEYHQYQSNINDALYCLNDLNNIVPTFRIKRSKTNKYYFTFCSPEASSEIVNYLLNYRKLNKEDKLFKINLDYLNNNFVKINNKLNLGKIGTHNRFRSHMLRKFHASSLYNCENSLTVDEIDALQGRKKDATHKSYFMENPINLKNKYIKALNSVTFY
ncbi:site-specific integrase [Methanobrevibacter boviskoreani]|uniref:site-specific integrase n=1 Tax=Methanobrevibacter boviskoreani TaxID=1348249 RepID=UPI0023F05FD6|nr:site-specific integrase [Methanobrevibacter boviskoreani]MDD6257423.1 site-specific integrase [Methanobrevibacter boviskoreani]